jgi:hypothetical protein
LGPASGPRRLRRAHGLSILEGICRWRGRGHPGRHQRCKEANHRPVRVEADFEGSFRSERTLKFRREGRGIMGLELCWCCIILTPRSAHEQRFLRVSPAALELNLVCGTIEDAFFQFPRCWRLHRLRVSLTVPLDPFLTRPQGILFVDHSIRHCRPATRTSSSSPPPPPPKPSAPEIKCWPRERHDEYIVCDHSRCGPTRCK